MKLSEVFLKTAENLPTDGYDCMCMHFFKWFLRAERSRERTKQEMRELNKLYNKAEQIMSWFKPKGARKGQYWFRVPPHKMPPALPMMDIATNAYVYENIEDMQAHRKEILLWCAMIAESEGL